MSSMRQKSIVNETRHLDPCASQTKGLAYGVARASQLGYEKQKLHERIKLLWDEIEATHNNNQDCCPC
jgi:hypothetical protein